MDAYRDQYAQLFNNGKVALLAISVDPIDRLASWAGERNYPFRFLSDPKGEVGKLYGAFERSDSVDNRTLYVIGPDGRITYVAAPFNEIDPGAYQELKRALEAVGR